MKEGKYTQKDGRRLFEEDRKAALADPEFRTLYEQVAEKNALWLQPIQGRVGIISRQLQRLASHQPLKVDEVLRLLESGFLR